MYKATLVFRLWKGRRNGFFNPCKTICADDENVLNPTVFEFIKNRQPILSAFVLANLYGQMIRSNIEYDYYSSSMKRHDLEEINGIVDIMTEILISRMPSFWIAGAEYPAGMVKDRMLRITSQHIDYVLECFHKSTVKIYNIKKYLLASLFNATSTIDSYYRNDANHDLYGFD